jgi:serine/threonine-protein kinase
MKSYVEKLNDDEEFIHRDKKGVTPSYEKTKKRLKPAGWIVVILVTLGLLIGGFLAASSLFRVAEVTVPDVIGISLEEAGAIIEREGLRVEIGREIYHQDIPVGYVINQNPRSDSVVRSGRVVTLDISMGSRLVEVPNVVGDDLRAARTRIESANLIVGEIQEVSSDTHPEGRVIGQDPLGGVMQDARTEVELVVSTGPVLENIQMPDLRGLAQADAENTLREVGLTLGIVSHQESNQYFTGQVVSQDVAPGRSIMQGSTINLSISRGPGPVAQTETIVFIVAEFGAAGQEHLVRIVVNDARGTRQEYERRHLTGDRIETGVRFYGQGVVRIYQDGNLAREISVP